MHDQTPTFVFTGFAILLAAGSLYSVMTGVIVGKNGHRSTFDESPFWYSFTTGVQLAVAVIFLYLGNPTLIFNILKAVSIPVSLVAQINPLLAFGTILVACTALCYWVGSAFHAQAMSGSVDLPPEVLEKLEEQQRLPGSKSSADDFDGTEISDRLDILDEKFKRRQVEPE